MNLLHETQVSYDVMQMDETTVQVLKEDGRAAQKKSRMWVRRGGPPQQPIILFDYEPTRAGAVAWRLLEDFKGFLQSDGYVVLEARAFGTTVISPSANAMASCISAALRMRAGNSTRR